MSGVPEIRGVSSWFSKYDQFGSFAKFNYRGESGYGTGLGGCCSLLLSGFVVVFVII